MRLGEKEGKASLFYYLDCFDFSQIFKKYWSQGSSVPKEIMWIFHNMWKLVNFSNKKYQLLVIRF